MNRKADSLRWTPSDTLDPQTNTHTQTLPHRTTLTGQTHTNEPTGSQKNTKGTHTNIQTNEIWDRIGLVYKFF